MDEDKGTALPGNVVRIDEERIKDHLGRIVRGTVEDTLNALLDAEADRLCNAMRYERTEARRDLRAGTYRRRLHTRAGEVSLRVPKLRRQTFETAISDRSRRSLHSRRDRRQETAAASATGGVRPRSRRR